ncbi:hypothetical protein JK203_15255 [Gluconobacter cerinus]|uniref:hypothetical protein n=1 Tax=Gluconobacter cerinus TaxID=38307 RepID=UPI001B8B2825|nr:hypothetical protein [Gluconobacter cerinus]MBS1035894.1 hypothetical protein [Gluconobacter cerinus]MBS1042177.1 hypothetical protein [Gluconobacter cerinus]MBS1048713.1 hypothetical protein [Gluconobacter cerinus]
MSAPAHANEYMMVNSAEVRERQRSARALKKGREASYRTITIQVTTNIHAICNALGNPVKLGITLRQDANITQTNLLWKMSTRILFLMTRRITRTG